MKIKRYGIMGGTFDPIHFGHLVAAEEARAVLGLEYVFFVPSGRPPHKKERPITKAEHRYLMTVLATATNPSFKVSRVDITRPGYSYTVDTISAFREMLGPDCELYFITGADAILQILSWKDVDRLFASCYLIAATRPGYDLSQLRASFGASWQRYSDKIKTLEVPALAISSSEIRRRVAAGEPIRYLLPESVVQYIYKHGLYGAHRQVKGCI
ncbi:MAG: nicotinate-nucleotide adenylyltransferase [Firmicutes bacterium]|jgi:nicotinate-nucleotide adenylyltransferase|nr:nicotinate-nucleotide adenylyltransferase [Bacillota bacterium]HOB22272.1 nicotinate-nucleotide adenylyltransferase [Bacillota bacterium]HQD39466.1 nicotinate-nucleotide adenylyltransferase [Bacillota bacterium]